MQKINLDKKIARQLAEMPKGTPLLLHACCAPCSTVALERLAPLLHLHVFYENPNIWPKEEFDRRRAALEQLLAAMPEAKGVALEAAPFAPAAFEARSAGLEAEPEGGARCAGCFALRLAAAARRARDLGYEWFTTTLTTGPRKDAAVINALGQRAAAEAGVKFLACDFKKREGYKRSIELSRQYGLYRQDYCGCRFSLAERRGQQEDDF